MRVGFTGTKKGMTTGQERTVSSLLDEYRPSEVHHGDCVGADEEFHRCALLVGCFYGGPVFHIHPPIDPKFRAFCKSRDLVMHPEKPYLERDHDVVDCSQILIATPLTDFEIQRSGTWATVRYARQINLEVFLVLRDGSLAGDLPSPRKT